MTPAAVSAKVNEELKALTKFMAADARANGQDGVAGAKRFVTDGAVLPDVDWEKDVEKKRDAAPVFMASLGAALQAESWYYDKKLMKDFEEKAEKEEEEGRASIVDGRLLRVAVNGEASEESEILFKSHNKRRLSLEAVTAERARREGSLLAALAIVSDMCVASRNRGQEVITPLLLELSVVCVQTVVRPTYDLLSSVKALLPRATAVKVLDEAASKYEGAFVTDVRDMAMATGGDGDDADGDDADFHDAQGGGGAADEFLDAEGPYATGVQVDNYVKEYGTRAHLLGGGVGNYVSVGTETRMIGGCRNNTLQKGDGGYGEAYDHSRLMGMFGTDNAAPKLLDGDDANSIWSFKGTVVTTSTLMWFNIFKFTDIPVDTGGPYRLRDHVLAPQVEACSASREDFKTHVLLWLKSTFGAMFVLVHLFFVFDTEYIPHYMSWLARGGAIALLLANTAIFPCKFHIRKHLAETLLARKPILRHIMVPLLLTVIPVSFKKWTQIGKEAEEDANGAEPEDEAAAEGFEVVAEIVVEAQGEEFAEVPRPRRQRKVPRRFGRGNDEEEGGEEEMDEDEGEEEQEAPQLAKDKEYAAKERAKLTEERHVRQIKNITPLRRLCRGFEIDSTGIRGELVERIITHLDLRPDYRALYDAENFTCKADLSRKGLSIAYLRAICGFEEIETTEEREGKVCNIARPQLEEALTAKIGLEPKRPKKQKSFNENVKMNLHRLNQTFFLLCFQWDGVKWGGSCVRAKVIDRCKEKYGAGLSDEEAVRRACAGSAFFTGLWCFFDIELRMVAEPFMDWERGNITLFLCLFPLMCMYVASSHKTKIPKTFLIIAERLKLYVDKHINVMRLFAANCIQFDEEKIEFANAVIGRWMPARVKNINISH